MDDNNTNEFIAYILSNAEEGSSSDSPKPDKNQNEIEETSTTSESSGGSDDGYILATELEPIAEVPDSQIDLEPFEDELTPRHFSLTEELANTMNLDRASPGNTSHSSYITSVTLSEMLESCEITNLQQAGNNPPVSFSDLINECLESSEGYREIGDLSFHPSPTAQEEASEISLEKLSSSGGEVAIEQKPRLFSILASTNSTNVPGHTVEKASPSSGISLQNGRINTTSGDMADQESLESKNNSEQTVPDCLLMPPLASPSLEEVSEKSEPEEKLIEIPLIGSTMGITKWTRLKDRYYSLKGLDEWRQIEPTPKETSLYDLLHREIYECIDPNVQIKIGRETFSCHLLLLRVYSEYFRQHHNESIILLPDTISANGFMLCYNWMKTENPEIYVKGILEMFNVAIFLRIKTLLSHCWQCFDDPTLFNEASAYWLFLRSVHQKVDVLAPIMLSRVQKYFLNVIASDEFLDMSLDNVSFLLSRNCICVNSEAEVFLSVVRWINHKWPERQPMITSLCKQVRFDIMPLWFLLSLQKPECDEMKNILEVKDTMDRVNHGITYASLTMSCSKSPRELLRKVGDNNLGEPIPRDWIYDKKCIYHNHSCNPEKTILFPSYKNFTDYLKYLNTDGQMNWRDFEELKEEEET